MGLKLNIRRVFLVVLLLISFSALTFSILGKGIEVNAKDMDNKQILEFLKEGYNAYWYIDESLDKEHIVDFNGVEYMKVNKNFHSKKDIKEYLEKFYTGKSVENFINRLSPKLIEGELYILAGEAGDKPYMNTLEIVDNNIKKGYITLIGKDKDGSTLYLKANVSKENNKLKIEDWKVI